MATEIVHVTKVLQFVTCSSDYPRIFRKRTAMHVKYLCCFLLQSKFDCQCTLSVIVSVCCLSLPSLSDMGHSSASPMWHHKWSACRFHTVPFASCTSVDDELVAAPATAGTHPGPDLKFLAQTVSPAWGTGSLLAAESLRTFWCSCRNCTLLHKSGFSNPNAVFTRQPINSSAWGTTSEGMRCTSVC